jgi:hypothetical protein
MSAVRSMPSSIGTGTSRSIRTALFMAAGNDMMRSISQLNTEGMIPPLSLPR